MILRTISDSLTVSDQQASGLVPTILSVSPTTGPAGGRATVEISGTDFALFTAPTSGLTDGVATPRVQVLFGGAAALRVDVLDANTIIAVTPEYPGDIELELFPPVTITVQNLNEAGAVVASATKALAYTFIREPLRRPLLNPISPYERVTRTLLQRLKRQLLLNVGPHVHTDYSQDGITLTPANVPSVSLTGPDVFQDDYGWENEPIEETRPDGSVHVYPNPMMHRFEYSVVASSDSWAEILALQGALRKFPWNNAWFVMTGDVPSGSSLRMPLVALGDPAILSTGGNANLHTCTISLGILRVPILYLPAGYRTWPVSSAELQTQKYNGTLVEVKNLW